METAVNTDRLIPLFLPFVEAYNATPNDFTLIGAAADAARETDDYELAEFLDWVRIKQRQPSLDKGGGLPVAYWGGNVCPLYMWLETPVWAESDLAANALWRLYVGWQSITPEQREECRKWSL